MNAQHQHVYTYPSHSYTQQEAYSYQRYPQNQWIQHHQQQQIHPKVQSIFERLENVIRTCNSVSRCLDTTLMSSRSGLTAFFRGLHQFQSLKQSLGRTLCLFSLARYFKLRARQQQCIHFSFKEFERFKMNNTKSRFWYYCILVLLVPFVIHYISLLKNTPKPCLSSNEKQPVMMTKKKLDFARARHAFEAKDKKELSLQCNDLIAVISRDDSDWWYGRLKNGKVGYFPANHVELIKKN